MIYKNINQNGEYCKFETSDNICVIISYNFDRVPILLQKLCTCNFMYLYNYVLVIYDVLVDYNFQVKCDISGALLKDIQDSVWYKINRRNLITIRIWFNLTIFRIIDISLCGGKSSIILT